MLREKSHQRCHLQLLKKINADIRLNYEKYFYDNKALAKPSERDKAVIELMVHF